MYFSIDGATAKCFLLCFNPSPPPFFLLTPANSPKPPKFFPPPFLLLLLLFAAVWSFLSSHELFLNLHGLDPIHFPCTSFIAFAKSIESIIDDDEGNEDEHFLDGERLLYAGHPSIASSPLGLFFVVGGITGGVWLYVIDPVFTLAGVGLSLLGMAYLSFMRFTQDYRITPRRIEVTTGFLARSSNEVRIEDIRAINVTCRGFTGIIGIGTVDFFTAGDAAEVSFRKIWAAQKVKTLVRRLRDTF